MTDKPTPEQIQRACDLANGAANAVAWEPSDYGHIGAFTALADTIAKLDAKDAMVDGQAALIATLTAERDKARADLGEIDRIAVKAGWRSEVTGGSYSAKQEIAAIAATYRVETDPLVAAISAAIGEYIMPGAPWDKLRAELAKRGLEIGRQA